MSLPISLYSMEARNERTDHVRTTTLTIDTAVHMEVVQRNGIAVVAMAAPSPRLTMVVEVSAL